MTQAARVSSALLALAGLAGAVMPQRVADSMDLTPRTGRGVMEVRAGLGAAYVALGLYAVLANTPSTHRAVGAAWLGAATGRLAGLALDEPRTDVIHWSSLALELGGGFAAIRS
jgi:hypothetical protein